MSLDAESSDRDAIRSAGRRTACLIWQVVLMTLSTLPLATASSGACLHPHTAHYSGDGVVGLNSYAEGSRMCITRFKEENSCTFCVEGRYHVCTDGWWRPREFESCEPEDTPEASPDAFDGSANNQPNHEEPADADDHSRRRALLGRLARKHGNAHRNVLQDRVDREVNYDSPMPGLGPLGPWSGNSARTNGQGVAGDSSCSDARQEQIAQKYQSRINRAGSQCEMNRLAASMYRELGEAGCAGMHEMGQRHEDVARSVCTFQ